MSNNNGANHILVKHGILVNFQIAKEIPVSHIKKLEKKLKPFCKNSQELSEKVNEEIYKDTQNSILNEKIPGFFSTGIFKKNPVKLPELNFSANQIGKFIHGKKLSKMETCYLILSILNLLGMTDEDFKKYHKIKNSEDNNEEFFDDTDDEGEDDDDGDEQFQ